MVGRLVVVEAYGVLLCGLAAAGARETQKPSRGRGEGGEVTSAEYLQANERTEKAAKPREMMDLRTAFILLCGCCREETGEKGRGGGE